MADVVGTGGAGIDLVTGLLIAASHLVGDHAAQQTAVIQENGFVGEDVEGKEMVMIGSHLLCI